MRSLQNLRQEQADNTDGLCGPLLANKGYQDTSKTSCNEPEAALRVPSTGRSTREVATTPGWSTGASNGTSAVLAGVWYSSICKNGESRTGRKLPRAETPKPLNPKSGNPNPETLKTHDP